MPQDSLFRKFTDNTIVYARVKEEEREAVEAIYREMTAYAVQQMYGELVAASGKEGRGYESKYD